MTLTKRRKTHVVTGLHVVKARAAGGLVKWYVYAWRGGPKIHECIGARPEIGKDLLRKAADAAKPRKGRMVDTNDLVDAYRESPEFKRLKPSTQKDYRLWLDRISAEFGPFKLAAFDDQRMRADVIEWRDTWADQPRTADKASVMMGTLLGWAQERAHLSINVAARIPQLHQVNKSDQIWEARHWAAVEAARNKDGNPAIKPHVMAVLRLARLTGLRLGDLVRLSWEQVGQKAIVVERTRKRQGRAIIPILPELRQLLDQLAAGIKPDDQGVQHKIGPILRNSRGQGWTESGVESVWQKAKPEGFDRVIHDLRGSYVTFLAQKRLTDEEIARIIGWTAQRIAEIRARYVDEERVIISLVERLSA